MARITVQLWRSLIQHMHEWLCMHIIVNIYFSRYLHNYIGFGSLKLKPNSLWNVTRNDLILTKENWLKNAILNQILPRLKFGANMGIQKILCSFLIIYNFFLMSMFFLLYIGKCYIVKPMPGYLMNFLSQLINNSLIIHLYIFFVSLL